jgi:hypothetical protein
MLLSRNMRMVLLTFAGLFLATKLLGLHVLTHQNDQSAADQCEICHIITADLQHAALSADTNTSFQPTNTLILQKEISTVYAYQRISDTCSSVLFSRPPPFV